MGRERGEIIKNSPLSPCGREVGGEGDYKNGMFPIGDVWQYDPRQITPVFPSELGFSRSVAQTFSRVPIAESMIVHLKRNYNDRTFENCTGKSSKPKHTGAGSLSQQSARNPPVPACPTKVMQVNGEFFRTGPDPGGSFKEGVSSLAK
ncbi:hypothetical protein [Kamptonema formosum]|uniref:hypothetical protein n=1 Tax=Kamptonema formosum TaxID=331992 RepID=UPI000345F361|nr:hypothetical protein [Oscillatoria sp. PCC 10802]